ncbi:MAG: dipeptidase [Clostridiaceae bacterium]
MKLIDLHCDTFYELCKKNNSDSIFSNKLCVDILKLRNANSLAQFFSLFVNKKTHPNCKEEAIKILTHFKNEVSNNSNHVIHGKTYSDLINSNGKITFFLTIEEGDVLDGKMDNLYYFHNEGVRIITLTWNFPNKIGFPNFNYTYANMGLTNFGLELIEEMNRLNVLIDVSHLSDKGFEDVINHSKKPIIASHSNCRSLCDHPRNLTDDMIRSIGHNGGIIGVNFYNKFLGNSSVTKLDDIVNHIDHLIKIGGVDVASIGSDFDGFIGKSELANIGEMDKLYSQLSKRFKDDVADKIFYKNALRLMKDFL